MISAPHSRPEMIRHAILDWLHHLVFGADPVFGDDIPEHTIYYKRLTEACWGFFLAICKFWRVHRFMKLNGHYKYANFRPQDMAH